MFLEITKYEKNYENLLKSVSLWSHTRLRNWMNLKMPGHQASFSKFQIQDFEVFIKVLGVIGFWLFWSKIGKRSV